MTQGRRPWQRQGLARSFPDPWRPTHSTKWQSRLILNPHRCCAPATHAQPTFAARPWRNSAMCVCVCVCMCVCVRACVCVRVRGKALEELSSVMKQPLGKRFVQENTRRGSMGCPLVLTPVMSDLTQGHCGAPLAHLWASLPTLRHCHLPPLSLLCSTHTPPG